MRGVGSADPDVLVAAWSSLAPERRAHAQRAFETHDDDPDFVAATVPRGNPPAFSAAHKLSG